MGLRRLSAGLLALILLTGCGKNTGSLLPQGGEAEVDQEEARAELEVQLGLLSGELTQEEYQAALDLWLTLKPIRDQRLEQGEWEKSDYEQRLWGRLADLLDQYTVTYLGGDAQGFGYQSPPEQTLAVYTISAGGALTPREGQTFPSGGWSEEQLLALWEDMTGILPEGAFDDFDRLTFFTDGPGETVAWVWMTDQEGARWEIALDPEDAGDRAYFVETVLHEYAHYLTLNDTQADYTQEQTLDTYNEYGMVTRPGSYLDDFYQTFWTGYLDQCLACDDTYNFFLRFYDDFIDAYASTDPSEDICESFTYFVLRPQVPYAYQDVWSQKLDFFYSYPELVEFRTAVRGNLGLARGDSYESGYDSGAEAA